MNIIILVISLLISNAPVQDSGYQAIGYHLGNQETSIAVSFSVGKQNDWSFYSWNSELYIFSEPLDLWVAYTLDSYEDKSYSIGEGFRG